MLSEERTIVRKAAPTFASPTPESTPDTGRRGDVATREPPAYSQSIGVPSGAPATVRTTPTSYGEAHPVYDAHGAESSAPEEVSGPDSRTSPDSQAAVEPMENSSFISGKVVEASEKRLDIGAEEAVERAPSVLVETELEDTEIPSPSRQQPRPATSEEAEVPTVEAEEVEGESGVERLGEVGSTRGAGFDRVAQRSQDPVVTINIGRIEVRAVNPEKPPTDDRGPSLSLQDYMKRRDERGR
ncbi:MAG: hypothetical protein OK456_01130 [Thaumarchaeota archaeon]|nr:hypothetical protein [Nitrososphaerota archaeon]